MIGNHPFLKTEVSQMRMRPGQPSIMPIDDSMGAPRRDMRMKPGQPSIMPVGDMRMRQSRGPITIKPFNEHNNQAVAPIMGHPRYGYQTVLNHDSFGKLPTAPSIVGGNTDWKMAKVTPMTAQLHDTLSMVRPMNASPTIGNFLNLREPSRDSIHTQY
jgi:hypothetical protein